MGKHGMRVAGVALLLGATGCSEPDCSELCGEAQEADCLWVSGDCEQFCSSLRQLADRTGCAAQADDYEDCLVDGEVCDAESRCATAAGGYLGCVAEHCASQPTDEDCMVVETAF